MLPAESLRQMQAPIALAPRIHFGFDRRRGGGEHHRDFRNRGAHHRHIAGVVMRAILLLIGGIVLLIDDDEAEIGVGQKQRRARADDHLYLVGGDRGPSARALARRKLRMPFRRTHAEARREAVEELPGERDLRHQNETLALVAHGLRHRLEIDLGLAGASDAVDQCHRKAALLHGVPDLVGGGSLRLGKIAVQKIRVGRRGNRLGRQHDRLQRTSVD